MAYVNTSRAAKSAPAEKVSGLFAWVSTVVQRRRIYDQTLRELRALSDRDLSDLGMHRNMITEVAREAAYGR